MKSRSRESRPQDIPTQPLRVSARIAEQPPQQAKASGTLPTTRSTRKKEVAAAKSTETPSGKAPPSKGKRKLQKKTAAPKRPQQSRKKKVTESSISYRALKEHEERTANEPLPEDLAKWKPDIVLLDSLEILSIYDPLMPAKLAECGVLDKE